MLRRKWSSRPSVLLCGMAIFLGGGEAAGLRGNDEPLWRSTPLVDGHADQPYIRGENHESSSNNNTEEATVRREQQPGASAAAPEAIDHSSSTLRQTPLLCELDPLVNDSTDCDIIGTHPTTPVCLYDTAKNEYKTVCVPITDTQALTATLYEAPGTSGGIHKRSYCGKCHACFQTKEELQVAVDKYKSRTDIDMTLASTYGWPIGEWCFASDLRDLSKLFLNKSKFNEDISQWDVRHVTNLDAMFQNAYAFNQPLDGWDTSRVTSMARMFAMAIHFDQPLNDWSVDRVSDMSYMFLHALQFNQDLSNWSVHNTFNLNSMFFGATNFQYDPLHMWASTLSEGANTDNMCQWSATTTTRSTTTSTNSADNAAATSAGTTAKGS